MFGTILLLALREVRRPLMRSFLTTLGIIASLAFDSFRFFQKVPVLDFLFGTQWSPQIAIRADQVGSSGAFGAVPLFAGTLLIMVIAT